MTTPIPPETAKEIADLVFARQKIAAIKLYREHSGKGLKEAKDFVEALEAELRAREPARFAATPPGKGCLGTVALCALAALAAGLAVVLVLMRGALQQHGGG